jgi:hypothetical protein
MQVFSIAPAPKAKRARPRGLRSDGSGASCCLDDPGFEMTLTLMEMFNSSTIESPSAGNRAALTGEEFLGCPAKSRSGVRLLSPGLVGAGHASRYERVRVCFRFRRAGKVSVGGGRARARIVCSESHRGWRHHAKHPHHAVGHWNRSCVGNSAVSVSAIGNAAVAQSTVEQTQTSLAHLC